ncbi:MAG TPA: substrate-binding domain-containing protein [Spirochaetia bacterium]|nr:substrate-binding domain-containing protein [Spirochaetia bacterium]
MRRVWKIWIPILLLVVVAVVLSQTRFVRLINRHAHESVYVVLKATGQSMEFWQIVRAGIQVAATEYDIEPKIVGPEWEKDVDKQIEILGQVIKKKPDAILLAASDYKRLVPLAEKAVKEGITIVTLDSALDSDAPVSFVATDNVAAGRKAGAEIAGLVPHGRPIAIISHIRGVATAIDREKGVRDALSDAGRSAPVGTFYSENDFDIAYRETKKLLAEYPNLGGIVALNENSAIGTGRALRDAGAAGRVKLVGFDNSQEEIEFLEDGVVQALIVQKPFNMGYLGIRTVVQALRGEKVPRVIHTESVLVRKEDMFTPENQKLLFPILRDRQE